jgi:HEAT repeat protein
VADLSTWRLWWEFNKDRFLHRPATRGAAPLTGDDALAAGRDVDVQGHGLASRELVQTVIVPALMDAAKHGGSNEFVQGLMLAMAKIGGKENAHEFEFVLRYFLSHGQPIIHRTSAMALGLLGGEAMIGPLGDLALDTPAGRALVTPEKEPLAAEVDLGVRAFAAHGLGLIGERTQDAAARKRIVEILVQLLEQTGHPTEDLHVAAMAAMGLVPLPVVEGANACYCGTCVVEGPSTSLQAQVTYLMRYFTAETACSPVARAHTATTLARLIEAQPAGMPEELGLGVAELLVDSLERTAHESPTVRQSVVLALGLVGDADLDPVDVWIRWALGRAARSSEPMEARFALIALAQVGSRPGRTEPVFAGTEAVRGDLLHALGNAKKDVRPWAGLALGVLEHEVRAHGGELSPAVELALKNALRTARTAEDLGAYALASGLRGDPGVAPLLLDKLARTRAEDARAYVALALGLSGAREAIQPLQSALLDEANEPLLESQVGLALGLLGADGLDTALATPASATTRAAIAQALAFHGDRRSIETLALLLSEKGTTADPVRTKAVQALGFLADRSLTPWRIALASSANYLAETPTLTCAERTGVLDLN